MGWDGMGWNELKSTDTKKPTSINEMGRIDGGGGARRY